MAEERWEIRVCARCEQRLRNGESCLHDKGLFGQSKFIEVVPASREQRYREALTELAKEYERRADSFEVPESLAYREAAYDIAKILEVLEGDSDNG